jgi:predicted homoserine dehydrogenase-like protein
VASVGLRREPTGVPRAWNGDVVATAKRDLREGETLDGEGGFTVYGKLMPAAASVALGGLPLGLAHRVKLVRPVASGQAVKWSDVAFDANDAAVRFRRQMESELAPRSVGQ